MEALLNTLQGAGPYLSVFVCLGGALSWTLRQLAIAGAARDQAVERLLAEREKRASEALETSQLLAASNQKLAEHTKVLEKVLDRWTHSPA